MLFYQMINLIEHQHLEMRWFAIDSTGRDQQSPTSIAHWGMGVDAVSRLLRSLHPSRIFKTKLAPQAR
jgi:hypothetical protein